MYHGMVGIPYEKDILKQIYYIKINELEDIAARHTDCADDA